MLTLILSILVLAGLCAVVWEFRAMARELKGLGEERESQTEARNNARIQKEIEKWREGK